jgi:hypothetical protein
LGTGTTIVQEIRYRTIPHGWAFHPNDAEIDGHYQLIEQIRTNVDFIGTTVLAMWRNRLQFDREHRCCASVVVVNHCLDQSARSRQPRWSCVLDTAADVLILGGLEYRIVGAQWLEHHKAVDDLAQGDGMFDTARSRHDRGSGDVGLEGPGMFGSIINAPPFGAEQRDRIAATALPQEQHMKPSTFWYGNHTHVSDKAFARKSSRWLRLNLPSASINRAKILQASRLEMDARTRDVSWKGELP